MPLAALVNSSNVVVNVIALEVDAEYNPPPGLTVRFGNTEPGATWNGSAFIPPAPVYPPIETLKESMLDRAWEVLVEKLEMSSVNVSISNTSYPFGCDSETRENISGINTAIAIGGNVPNPRTWLPKGYTNTISVSHSDLSNIGMAILNKKDQMMGVYFVHKAYIKAQSNSAVLVNYDVTTGYDS